MNTSMASPSVVRAAPAGPRATRTRSRRTCVAVAAAALVLTACGSTVPLAQQRAATGPGGTADQSASQTAGAQGTGEQALPGAEGGVLQPGPAAGAGLPDSTAHVPGVGPSSGRGAAGGAPRSGSGATAAPGAAGAAGRAVAAKGPGWDEKNVYLGVITQKDAKEVFARFGGGVDPGDTEAQARAVADEINAKGGILGRKVVLVFRDQPTLATASDPNGTGAAACTYFSEDKRVLAVFNVVTVMDYPPFRACLAKAGIPLFSAGVKTVDDTAGRALAPNFYQSLGVSWDALAPVLVQRLQAQGWFSGWNVRTGTAGPGTAKVGILVDGTDVGSRIGKRLQKVLAAAGSKGALVYQYNQASEGQQASVNYFAGNGVTHVIVTDVELTAFQTSANGQGYRPRYGITTYNAPANNLESSLTPAGANNGALGVGWVPTLDVSAAKDPGASAPRKACVAVMAKARQSFAGKRLAESYATALCDYGNLVKQGAGAGGGFTPAQVFAGLSKIGPSFPTAVGFSSGLSADKLFVPGTVRDLGWDNTCRCVTYRSGTARL
ncbi:MAG: hypothetical protein JWO60_1928 [Frankiales bacterium]|nr:hypothetical protein [Frankiales bacterium]